MPSERLQLAIANFGRARKRKQSCARTYTAEENSAWSNRPRGCFSLDEAIKLWRARDVNMSDGDVRKRDAMLTVAEMKKHRAAWDLIPERCYPHEHPLRTGRPGVLYHKSDYVGPILDAMMCMHEKLNANGDVFNVLERPAKKKRGHKQVGEIRPDSSMAASLERRRVAFKRPAWACFGCGNTDVKSQVVMKEATSCPCGVVVMVGSVVNTHREKLGASEEDDKTQHADKPYESKTDKYDRPPQTTEERRVQRRCAGKITNVGSRAKGLGRLCDVQRISEQLAQKDVDARADLDQRQILKLQRILEETERMFSQLAPVDHAVKRTVRRAVDVVWTDSVKHGHACQSNPGCELRLADRSAFIIAAAVFEITIDRIITREIEPDQLDHEHVVDLQMRMQRSAAFNNNSSLTQMATAKVMIRLMQEAGFDPRVECQLCQPMPAVSRDRSSGKKLAPIRAPPRVQSFSFGENSPPPSENVQFRDALTKVFLAHKCELPVAVRDGALRAIQSPGFMDTCKGMDILKPYSISCVAFCALVAISRVQSEASSSFASLPPPLNVALAGKLGLDLVHAEQAIESIRGLVPSDAASEASDHGDDDLFV